ncbi:MAG TPA: NAD-dependent epimerase/dehydratase family protein, partial [Planctomycetes bacterium]|nr:NAD-dependent epimerase/dehydratase family protein [Planctomycetota bacterium]
MAVSERQVFEAARAGAPPVTPPGKTLRILVTGGAGGIGSRLVEKLAAAGHKTRALILPADPLKNRLAGINCEIVEGDVAAADTLAGALAGIDTVYHLAAVIVSTDPAAFGKINAAGTANVVKAATAAGARHFIYVSSASVTYGKPTPYAKSKMAGEDAVRNAPGLPWTIVRPTLVYDREGGLEMEMFLNYLKKFPVVPFVGMGRARKRPVYAGDMIDGLARIAGNERTYGKTYNFSGGETVTMLELARLLLEHEGLKRMILPLPEVMWMAAAAVVGAFTGSAVLVRQGIRGFIEDADLDNAEALRDIGFNPVPAR